MLIGGREGAGPDEAKGGKVWSRTGAKKESSLVCFIPHDTI